jgi:DNA-binding IclR family transcriptional regulator
MKGGICYAAPVFDYTGRAVAAIGTTVLTVHYEREQLERDLGARVQKTARIISTTLGYTES